MPSILGENLVDKLVPTVDKLRANLLPAMGVRQYTVAIVKRRWSGEQRGEGTASVVSTLTLSPPPLLTYSNNLRALHYDLQPTGADDEGTVSLSEVSLTYSEVELTGGALAANEEMYYRITDDQGQGIAPRYYMLSAPPVPDREKAIGWQLSLRRVEIEEAV
jgi:hypothetical protein